MPALVPQVELRSARTVGGRPEGDGRYDLVWAVAPDASRDDPLPMLDRCRSAARRSVTWVAPGDDTRTSLEPTLAGYLPPALLDPDAGEPVTLPILLSRIARRCPPNIISSTAWTMTLVVHDLDALAAAIAGRPGWSGERRRTTLLPHPRRIATAHPVGFAVPVLRRSAVLAWTL